MPYPAPFLRVRNRRCRDLGEQPVQVFGRELRVAIGKVQTCGLAVHLRQRMTELVADEAPVADIDHAAQELGVEVLGRAAAVPVPYEPADPPVGVAFVLTAEMGQDL